MPVKFVVGFPTGSAADLKVHEQTNLGVPMDNRFAAVVIFSVLTLFGCAKPVPPEKDVYVGAWRSQTMALLITQDGSVSYKRLKGGVKTEINGPLQKFDGNNFHVGVAFLSTTFEVSKPPFQQDGQWKMVVDGVELSKQQP